MAEGKRVSANPTTFVEGGGLLDKVNVRFAETTWTLEGPPNYKSDKPNVFLRVQLTPLEDGAKSLLQWWSGGAAENFVPTDDGMGLIAVGKREALTKDCNAALLLASIVNAPHQDGKSGFDAEKLDGDINVLDGLEAFVERQAQPKRGGSIIQTGPNRREDPTYLAVTKILVLPGAAAGKAKGATAGKAKASTTTPTIRTATPVESNGIYARADETVMALLMENGGTLPRAKISALGFKALIKDAARNDIVKTMYDEGYLGSEGRPFQYKDGIVSLS